MIFVKLTSAVGSRVAVHLNVDHMISFSDQAGGGCAIKTDSGVLAVTESAETVLKRIAEAKALERERP